MSSFSIALSGLTADSSALDVVGNNLANLNTTGYKDSTVSFYDLLQQSVAGGSTQIGGGVSAPSVLSKVEPEYSEEARKAKWQGTVTLQLVVDEHGMPQAMTVMRSLGLGLDQKALEAVGKWRFKPGMKDGKPVPVIATVEVNFRLL